MYVTDPPAKFSAVAICSPEICSLVRLGSPGAVLAGFPARVSITTPTISASTNTPPTAIGIQLRGSLCSAAGENTGTFSESPMAEILTSLPSRSKRKTVHFRIALLIHGVEQAFMPAVRALGNRL